MEWTGEFVRWLEEPGPELPSQTTGSPEPPPFTATWQGTERPTMKKTTILQLAISLVALVALALSLAAFFTRPEANYIELDDAIGNRHSQLEKEFDWIEPEEETNGRLLIWNIKKFTKWKNEWQEFAQAYRAYGALTSEIRRGEADVFDTLKTSRARKKELEFKAVATQAIKPPTAQSQIILSVDEVIQLSHTLIEVGWAKDIELAELLEERAKHEQPANPENAKQLRKVVENLR